MSSLWFGLGKFKQNQVEGFVPAFDANNKDNNIHASRNFVTIFDLDNLKTDTSIKKLKIIFYDHYSLSKHNICETVEAPSTKKLFTTTTCFNNEQIKSQLAL